MNPYASLMNDAMLNRLLNSNESSRVKEPEVEHSGLSAQEAFRELMCDGKLNRDSDFYNSLEG